MNFIKIKNSYSETDLVKRQAAELEKIFANHVSGKKLSAVCKKTPNN